LQNSFSIAALIAVISLPIDSGVRGQIISFIGIVISAALALSAPTVFSNALAGIMNANMKNVNLGDFIRIENHFGRVTKKGLFRTEIQTEDRNLLSFPNLYMANHPIKIMRDSGTIVAATVSLGYDVDRAVVEKHLLAAASEVGLLEPYVYITELGDFAVTYKVHGLLTELGKYLTMAAKLNAKVMDHLHLGSIEIVSPAFMNQRQVNENRFISNPPLAKPQAVEEKAPEDLIFDKAIRAEEIDDKRKAVEALETEMQKLKQRSKTDEDKSRLEARLKHLESLKGRIEANIAEEKRQLDEDD
jgi:small conductance mechanosensitive channel